MGLEDFTGSEVFPMKPGLRLHVDRKGKDWAGLPLDRLLVKPLGLCGLGSVSPRKRDGKARVLLGRNCKSSCGAPYL